MAIKNIIFDLGGVWLPIDERRTLAAFAALAGSPAAEAAGAQGDKPAAEAALDIKRPTRCEAALRERSVRGGETAWSPRTGAGHSHESLQRRDIPNFFSYVFRGRTYNNNKALQKKGTLQNL